MALSNTALAAAMQAVTVMVGETTQATRAAVGPRETTNQLDLEDYVGDKHDARPMSRCLLRNRYVLLLEAATATSVEADCTLATSKLDVTQAREGQYAGA